MVRSVVLSGAMLAAIVSAFATPPAVAQPRDLTVEEQPDRPARPVRPSTRPARQLAVSLVPVGPSTLFIGQPIAFRLSTTMPSYGHLYALSASGKVQVWLENVPMRPGRVLSYPPPNNVVRAAPPGGDEIVVFVATRARAAGFAGGRTLVTPYDTQLSHAGFRQAIVGLTHNLPRRDWALTETVIRIVNR